MYLYVDIMQRLISIVDDYVSIVALKKPCTNSDLKWIVQSLVTCKVFSHNKSVYICAIGRSPSLSSQLTV